MDMKLPAIARVLTTNAEEILKSFIDTHPVKAHEATISAEVVAKATPSRDNNPSSGGRDK